MGVTGMRRVAATNGTKREGIAQGVGRGVAAVAFRIRRRAASGLLLLMTIPVGYKAIYGNHGWYAYHQELRDTKAVQAEIEDLRTRNEHVQENIKALKSDPQAIEREAREHLRYARPGDVIISVPAPGK
jgi:cell division protein FtsB